MSGPGDGRGRRLSGDARARLAAARLPRGLSAPAAGAETAVTRGLGAPALFAVVVSTVGAAIYFALGVVAEDALGLTPLVFLVAGGFLIVTMWTYVEGNSLHPERGGASALARYAFNELWSFIAGWAILLDYVIVLSIAAFALSHYLEAFWSGAGDPGIEMAITALALGFVAWSNIRGAVSTGRLNWAVRIGILNLALAVVLIVVGLAVAYEPGELVDSVDLGSSPSWDDIVFATVIATVAVTGVDAASGLAGDLRVGRRKLRRFVFASTGVVLVTLVGVSAVALMAQPPAGGTTPLGGQFVDAPVLGIADAFEPAWVSDVMKVAVGVIASLVLLQAMNVNMLGISRLAYALATNRQIPSAVGRLHPRFATPYVTIGIASLMAFVLAIGDVEFLLGLFAFGALLSFTIAHVSVVALRFRERGRHVAFRVPLSVRVRGVSLPLPAIGGALFAFAAWISVIVLHEGARNAGAIWMAAGLLLYVVYRKGQGKTLSGRFVIPAEALAESRGVEYQSILVPVFGEPIDDDIVGTAGRLAAEEWEEGEGGPMIEALYVIEVPMSLPLDARLPDDAVREGRAALARAKAVGEEYENVEVATALVRGRAAGATIVDEARRRGVQAIVLAAERPTRMRGGALLGGRGRARDRVLGAVTQYVVEKAPCRVILTAPPAGEETSRVGVRP